MTRSGQWLGAVLLGAAAVLALLWLVKGRAQPAGLEVELQESALARDGGSSPSIAGEPVAAGAQARAERVEETLPPAEEDAALVASPVQVMLEGKVVARGGLPAESATLSLARRYQVPVEADGSFRYEVTRLAVPGGRLAVELWIYGVPLQQHEFTLPLDLSAPDRLDPEGRHVLRVVFRLEDPLLVRGQARGEDGAPIEGADVGIYRDQGSPGDLLRRTRTDAAGNFLLADVPAVDTILAVAREGLRPCTLRLSVEPFRDVGTLVLERGSVLAGSTPVGEAELRRGLEVEASSEYRRKSDGDLGLGSSTLLWQDDRFEVSWIQVPLDEHGSFSFAGLRPGQAYRLDLGGCSGGFCMLGTNFHRGMTATAPDEAVWFPLDVPRIWFSVRDEEDRPIEHASMLWVGGGLRCYFDYQQGTLLLGLPAGQLLEVLFEAPGYRSLRAEVQGPALGEVEERTVRLERIAVGELAFCVEEGSGHPEDVRLELFPAGAAAEGEPLSEATADVEQGCYRFPSVPAGSYRARLVPGSYGETSGWWLPLERDVEVSAQRPARVDVAFEEGGRLRVRVADGAGNGLPAVCTIRSSGGGEVPGILYVSFQDAQRVMRVAPSGEPLPGAGWSPAVTDPPLPAGTYTLRAELEGHTRAETTVDLSPGATLAVELVLLEE